MTNEVGTENNKFRSMFDSELKDITLFTMFVDGKTVKMVPIEFHESEKSKAKQEGRDEVVREINTWLDTCKSVPKWDFNDYKVRLKEHFNKIINESILCEHSYSRSMDQEYPRKCTKCGAEEVK